MVQQVGGIENIFPHASNFYERIVFDNCSRPFSVYLKTFLPAFIKMALTVALLDLNDAFRATGDGFVDTDRRGRKGRGRKFRKPRMINSPNTVQRWSSRGLQTIIRVTAPLETVGFIWLLYAAGDRFFYDWQNLLTGSTFCGTDVQPPIMQRSRLGGRVGILPGGESISYFQLDQQSGGIFSNSFGANSTAGSYAAWAALTVTGPQGGISGVFLRLNIQIGVLVFEATSTPVDIKEGEEVDLIVFDETTAILSQTWSITWELVGPAVPIGLASRDGAVNVSRFEEPFLP